MRITVPRWIRRAFWCFIHDRDEVSPLGVYFSGRQTYERFGDHLLRERCRPPRRRFSDRPIAGAPFYGRTPREYDEARTMSRNTAMMLGKKWIETPFAIAAARAPTRVEYTVMLNAPQELLDCIEECAGDQKAGVHLWIKRRGERAQKTLATRMLELYG